MSIQNTIDEKWMRVALSLSRRNKGATWPNPHVGCLIVKDEQVIGRGWTAKSGRPHAETQALLQAGENANGSTAYVTLARTQDSYKHKPSCRCARSTPSQIDGARR